MGQAGVDLPDPLEQPPNPTNSADELMSQLVGEQIDRLLAQAEVEAPARGPSSDSPALPATPGDAVLEAEARLSAQLDELFSQLNQTADVPPAAEAPPARHVADIAIQPRHVEQSGVTSLTEDVGPQERHALAPAEPAPELAPDPAPRQTESAPDTLPFYLRPLEWLNRPLAHATPSVRRALGWAGIVTFLNATGILIYVLFFRR